MSSKSSSCSKCPQSTKNWWHEFESLRPLAEPLVQTIKANPQQYTVQQRAWTMQICHGDCSGPSQALTSPDVSKMWQTLRGADQLVLMQQLVQSCSSVKRSL